MTPNHLDISKTISELKKTNKGWSEIKEAYIALAFERHNGVRKRVSEECGYSIRYIGYMANHLREIGYPIKDSIRAAIAYSRARNV